MLLHFDFRLRTLLSQLEIRKLYSPIVCLLDFNNFPEPAPALAPGFSSVPPFITALAVSPQGVLAAGTADGRIFVGLGGAKALPSSASSLATSSPSPSSTKGQARKKKKGCHKWNGLAEDEGFVSKVADCMISGLAFVNVEVLVSCTVYGQVSRHSIVNLDAEDASSQPPVDAPNDDEDAHSRRLQVVPLFRSSCAKVHAFTARKRDDGMFEVAIAGVHDDGRRGCVEVWDVGIEDGPNELTGAEVGDGTNPSSTTSAIEGSPTSQ